MKNFSILCFFVTMEIVAAMFIPEQNMSNMPFEEQDQQNQDRTQRNVEGSLSTGGPSIRIRINTNSRNGVPYIFLRRRPNTNMRLRIQNTSSNNGPLRIVYNNRNKDMNRLEGRNNEQQTQSIQPRIILNSENEEILRRQQIILKSRDARFRVRSETASNIRFRQ